MIRAHYSCEPVGERWDVGYFESMDQAIRYVQENCVDERSGYGCYFDDFNFDEVEEDLIKVDLSKPIKFNPNYSEHRKNFKGILKCKVCKKNIEPKEIDYSNYCQTDTIIAHKQCVKDKKFGKQFSNYQEIVKN